MTKSFHATALAIDFDQPDRALPRVELPRFRAVSRHRPSATGDEFRVECGNRVEGLKWQTR